jgi:hypothetical protein
MLRRKPFAVLAVTVCCAALAIALTLVLGGTPQRASGLTAAQAMTNCSQSLSSNFMQGYGATQVAMASSGTAAQVQQWNQTRPSSAGGAPNRDLTSVSSDTVITICVVQGTYPSMAPPPPGASPGSTAAGVDGGRFFLFPDGTIVIDAIGPLSQLESSTPSNFSQY